MYPCFTKSAGSTLMNMDGVAVCIAAYNEERTIGKLIRGLRNLGLTKVIVVDDGSKDGTTPIARSAGARVIRLASNSGQWVALRNAFRIALQLGSDIIVTFDADGQHVPQTILPLVRPVQLGEADITIASRFRQTRFSGKKVRKMGISSLNMIMWLMTKHHFTDCTSGLTAMKSDIVTRVLPDLTEPQFGRLEFWLRVAKQSPRIVELPIPVRPSAYSNKGQLRFMANLIRTVVKTSLIKSENGPHHPS